MKIESKIQKHNARCAFLVELRESFSDNYVDLDLIWIENEFEFDYLFDFDFGFFIFCEWKRKNGKRNGTGKWGNLFL